MKSRNMKLGTRIMMGYAVVLVFLVVTIFIGISRMTVSNGHLNLIINDRQAKMQLTYRMINEVNNIDIAMRNMAITGDETVLNNEKNKLEEARKIYRNAFEELSRIEVSEKGKQLLASIKEELGKGKNMNGKAIGMALDKKQTEASGIITTELSKTRLNVLNSLHALISFEEDMMKQAGEEAAQAYKSAWILMCLTGVVAVILSIVLATINIRSITRPINHTIEGMNDASAHVAA